LVVKASGKKLVKISAIFLSILIVLLLGFHFWFKAHARKMIEDLVETKSNGKLKMKVKKFKFGYFSKKMTLHDVVFYNTDTVNEKTTYQFSIAKINVQAKGIFPIIFQNQLLIDSLVLHEPDILVTRLKSDNNEKDSLDEDVSIPEEMGKIYKSIQDGLSVLKVTRFRIIDGRFTLLNKIKANQRPISINHLDFLIENILIDADNKKSKQKILFSDNVVMQSHDQDIIFPDERHRLSFSNFRINLKNRLVEFDSCTITALPTDSSASSFAVFFDALKLININFDTLYRSEVIKADSVYCVNPKFNLTVDVEKKKGVNKPPPKLEEIVKQLTGDLLLNYVVVSNADFNINILKNDKPTSFVFSQNNFEMQGLTVNQRAAKPVTVNNFAMAIRNYENFIKDSTYSVQFDSVLFRDDHIYLSNFQFNKLINGKTINSFVIPQFYLSGLSWDDLVFERKLKANQATMYFPTIKYSALTNRSKKGKASIFKSLDAINDYMDLEYLDIIEGNIDYTSKKDLRIQLSKATLSIQSHSLLNSTKLAGIKNSISKIKFENGIINAGDLQLQLKDIRYTGNSGQFIASTVAVSDKTKKLKLNLDDIQVEKMKVNELTGDIVADGITWSKGDIAFTGITKKSESGQAGPFIVLRNIHGNNTNYKTQVGNNHITTYISSISLTELQKKPGQTLQLTGLALSGTQLKVANKEISLSVNDFSIVDNAASVFHQLHVVSDNQTMQANIQIPAITFTPYIHALMKGEIEVNAITIDRPQITIHQFPSDAKKNSNTAGLPKINISNLFLQHPVIDWSSTKDTTTTSFKWNGNHATDFIRFNSLQVAEGEKMQASLANLNFDLSNAVFTSAQRKQYSTGNGRMNGEISKISIKEQSPDSMNKTPYNWEGNVASLNIQDFKLDSLGKSASHYYIKSLGLKNATLSSSVINDMHRLMAANKLFSLANFSGTYADSSQRFSWFNTGFNRTSNTLTLDSFFFNPAQSRDSFLANKKFETDYIDFRTGKIEIGPVNIENYVRENKLTIEQSIIDDLLLTDYRDKRMEFNAGILKPLSSTLIKNIPLEFSVGKLQFNNAAIEYTEVSDLTKKAATIPITRMNATIRNIKNLNFSATDSLELLTTGYLMDSIWMRLSLHESYTDTLGGFKMFFSIKPSDLTLLNPVVMPMSSVKLKSGYIDTLSMVAVGREYLALGEMKMFYHDLKIEIYKKDGSEKRWLLTFLANTILKNKNTSRTGNIFFIRKRDRSAINYLVKIVVSGITSSVGVKNNKRQLKKYKKTIEARDLPPILLEPQQ